MRNLVPSRRPSLTRRRFLAASVGTLPAVTAVSDGAVGHTNDAGHAQNSGIVWARRENGVPGRYWTDIVAANDDDPLEHRFILCGHDYGNDYGILRSTDKWGRELHQRDDGFGDSLSTLVAHDKGYLVAGIEETAPLLIGIPDPYNPNLFYGDWQVTYDGTPTGPVHATTTDDGLAIGWTDAAETTGGVVVGTDDTGTPRWTDHLADGRRVAALVPAPTSEGTVGAVGPHDGESTDGWATVWGSDGTRIRDRPLDTPGDGPGAAVADGSAVVVAGTGSDGWWLQRRTADWSVEWEQRYPDYSAGGGHRPVDDLVRLADGYGLLSHDATGVRLVRTDDAGTERWRGYYAPYDEETTDDGGVRGHSMIPVERDQFVVVGSATAGENYRYAWMARVGEPGRATPVPTPTPTPTDTPRTMPPTQTRTPTPTPSPTTDGGQSGSVTGTPTRPPTAAETSTDAPGAAIPGFGVVAALAGVVGWVVARRRDA